MEPKSRLYPANPLGIIATFVFFIEAITASSLHLLRDHHDLLEKIVYFIIAFPTFIAIAFFAILVAKREALFAPGDFKDEENFVKLLTRVRELELDQEINAVSVDPPSEIESVFSLTDELLTRDELKNVVRIGRGYLKSKDYLKAKRYFEYVKSKASKNHPLYYKVIANIAYAEIGLCEYQDALINLKEVERLLGDNIEIWQLSAMAYVFKKLGKLEDSVYYQERTLNHPAYEEEKSALKFLFKDMEEFAR